MVGVTRSIHEAIALAVLALSTAVLLLVVLAPWRSIRRERLDERDYLAFMAGERGEPAEPGEPAG